MSVSLLSCTVKGRNTLVPTTLSQTCTLTVHEFGRGHRYRLYPGDRFECGRVQYREGGILSAVCLYVLLECLCVHDNVFRVSLLYFYKYYCCCRVVRCFKFTQLLHITLGSFIIRPCRSQHSEVVSLCLSTLGWRVGHSSLQVVT